LPVYPVGDPYSQPFIILMIADITSFTIDLVSKNIAASENSCSGSSVTPAYLAKPLFFVFSSQAQEGLYIKIPTCRLLVIIEALLLPAARLSMQPLNMVCSKTPGEVQDGRLP
jgi:hypothetical protein